MRVKVSKMLIKKAGTSQIDELRQKILPILKRHDVSRAGIFGSTATGEAKETSDVDLLVEFKGEKSLFDLVALKLDMEAAVNRKVDVLTYRAINPLIREKVLEQEIRIL